MWLQLPPQHKRRERKAAMTGFGNNSISRLIVCKHQVEIILGSMRLTRKIEKALMVQFQVVSLETNTVTHTNLI